MVQCKEVRNLTFAHFEKSNAILCNVCTHECTLIITKEMNVVNVRRLTYMYVT